LRHLSYWLLCKAENEIENRYQGMRKVCAAQNVALADFCWSMVFTKEQIRDFVQQHGYLQSPLEIYGEMERLRLLDRFFERAICYRVEGYQRSSRMDPRSRRFRSWMGLANLMHLDSA
jgi:hypothetical protein